MAKYRECEKRRGFSLRPTFWWFHFVEVESHVAWTGLGLIAHPSRSWTCDCLFSATMPQVLELWSCVTTRPPLFIYVESRFLAVKQEHHLSSRPAWSAQQDPFYWRRGKKVIVLKSSNFLNQNLDFFFHLECSISPVFSNIGQVVFPNSLAHVWK